MASRLQPLPVADFTGGLNLQRDPFQLAPNESPDMLNVEIDPRGGLRSRDGWVRWNSTPIAGLTTSWAWDPKALSVFALSNGTRIVMMASGNTVLHGEGNSWSTLSSTMQYHQGGVVAFSQWGNTMYVASAGQQPFKWSGSGLATQMLTPPSWQNDYAAPVGGYMPLHGIAAVHQSYLFVVSSGENANRLRWSHPNSPENWAQNDFIDILDGGDKITALVSFGDQLLIFKSSSVWSLRGYEASNFALVNVTRQIGTESQATVARTETAVYFFDWPRGLFRLSNEGVEEVSRPIRPALLDGSVWAAAIAAGDVFVSVVNGRVWLSLPYDETASPTAVKRTFIYDPSLGPNGAWTAASTADGFGIGPACELVSPNGERRFLGLHPTLPRVLLLEQEGEDADVISSTDEAFVSHYKTPWINIGVPTQRKLWRRPDLVAKRTASEQSLLFQVFKDYDERSPARQFTVTINANGGLVWGPGTGVWGGDVEFGVSGDSNEIERGGAMGSGRSVQLRVSGTPGIRWALNAIVFKVIPRRLR